MLSTTTIRTSANKIHRFGTSTAPGRFHTCGVFAWMFGDDWGVGRREMEHERSRFETKMKFHHDRLNEADGMMEPPEEDRMICAHLDMMRAR